jgi:spermidine synthase
MAMKLGVDLPLRWQVAVYCAAVLACCMVLHGELARLKPHHEWLTEFFLTISAGGALGSAIVTLVAPRVLNAFYEFPVALMASCFLLALVLYRQAHRDTPAALARSHVLFLVLLVVAGVELLQRFESSYLLALNDYGHDKLGTRVESIAWLSGNLKQLLVSTVDQTWQMAGFALMCLLLPIMVRRKRRGPRSDWLAISAAATVALVSGMIGAHMVIAAEPSDALSSTRNFFGILRVSDSADDDPRTRTLTNGHITHGVQRLDDAGRRRPTTYYSEESGVGIAINTLRRLKHDGAGGLRIGVVGLGAGTLAAYGTTGDAIRFYEINSDVVRLNREHFTFLKDTPARVVVSLGDARIIMERERTAGNPQGFDVLAVDAFSGDAVPLHLLTREAFGTYFYHLAPDGVLAMHVSNRYLNLAALVRDLAEAVGRPAIKIQNVEDHEQTIYASTWVLVTSNKAFLDDQAVQDHTTAWEDHAGRPKLLFSDDYANIFRILRRPDSPYDE